MCWRGSTLPDEHLSFYETLQQSKGKYRVPGYLATCFLEDQAWEHMYYHRRAAELHFTSNHQNREEGVRVQRKGKRSKPRQTDEETPRDSGSVVKQSAPVMWQIHMHPQGRTLFKYRCKHVLFVQVRIIFYFV
jgi:hypothetical protein